MISRYAWAIPRAGYRGGRGRKPYPARSSLHWERARHSRGRHNSASRSPFQLSPNSAPILHSSCPRSTAGRYPGSGAAMAVVGARPFLAPLASLSQTCLSDDTPSARSSVSFCGCLSTSAGDVVERLSPGRVLVGATGCSRGRLVVVGRAGGSRPAAGARRPRPQTSRRPGQKEEGQGDGTLLNGDIR